MDVLVGLLAIAAGLSIALAGLRLFFFMLPIWGFVLGVIVGGAGVTAVFGDGFLSTFLGIIVGLVVGIIFAIVSYLYWYFGVLIATGGAGWSIGTAIFATIGVSNGWLLFFIGLAFAVLFVFLAVAINYPIFLVIVSTAMGGATIAIAGLLLVLNKIDRVELGMGATWSRINDHWILWLLWIIGAAIGIGAQMTSASSMQLPEEKWAQAPR